MQCQQKNSPDAGTNRVISNVIAKSAMIRCSYEDLIVRLRAVSGTKFRQGYVGVLYLYSVLNE